MSKVVILEKDFDLADNIKEILSYKNYEVCSIGSGINSKALVNRFSPSFVILGTRLNGGKDGIETARDIRKDYSCPLLFLSTNENSESIRKLIKRIPNSFILQKPFSIKSLHLAVDQVLSPKQ
ncbi:response regulator [Echinicola shivajiensis]|uniref:response regulator n=1 Tax=Echinicola shivajiensis TaxID=1035916 RepID=UPI001BFC684E|nr:response regulator [Echinicola shivajiensis]